MDKPLTLGVTIFATILSVLVILGPLMVGFREEIDQFSSYGGGVLLGICMSAIWYIVLWVWFKKD